jgi:hypothetical protein
MVRTAGDQEIGIFVLDGFGEEVGLPGGVSTAAGETLEKSVFWDLGFGNSDLD